MSKHTTIAQAIQQLKDQRTETQRQIDSLKNMLIGENYVVHVGNGLYAGDKTVAHITRAARYAEPDAIKIVARINAANPSRTAVHHVLLIEALKTELKNLDTVIGCIVEPN